MKIAILGSGATNHRIPKDIDILGSYGDIIQYLHSCGNIEKMYPSKSGNKQIAKIAGMMYEGEIAWENSLSEELLNLILTDPDTTVDKNGLLVPSINVLYMLKMSHRFLRNSPAFRKTMLDIQYLRDNGAIIGDDYWDFYKRREKNTYDYPHPKLNVDKKDFFDDSVKYLYEHDDIHVAVKIFDKPAYEFFKPNNSQVLCDKDMFFSLDERYRLAAVQEESMVLAIERSLVPFPGVKTPKQAFEKALEKVCTSITSGWFRSYAWENYDLVMGMYDNSYFDKFKAALSENKIRFYGR